MSAFNRLHFYKKFDPAAEYIAIKVFNTGGKQYFPGVPYDLSMMPMHKNKAMFHARKITFAEEANKPAVIAAVVQENEVIDLVPKVVTGKTGYKSVMVNGEKIGKSSRDDEVIKQIVDDWLAA